MVSPICTSLSSASLGFPFGTEELDQAFHTPQGGCRTFTEEEEQLVAELADEISYIDSPEFTKPMHSRIQEHPSDRSPGRSWYRPLMGDAGASRPDLTTSRKSSVV